MRGEDEIIGFESLKETLVFWNIDDYPIPTDDFDAIFVDILEALDVMGFRNGYMEAWLYTEQLNCDEEKSGTIKGLPEGKSYSATACKVPDITLYMIHNAYLTRPGPVNFLVIAKPKRELDRVLQCLKSRRHNVLIVKPPPPDEEFLVSGGSLLENARFLGGGKPRFKELYASFASEYDMSYEEYEEIKEDLSKMVDFSERIPTVKGARTAVFWDAEDCPFPRSSTPDQIYHSISSALVPRDFSDKITIWVYLDDGKKGSWRDALLAGDKTWASRIYFLPGGDKASRRIRMLNDMFLWVRDSPSMTRHCEQSLVVFADQFKYAALYTDMLQNLNDLRYDLLLVTPTADIKNPESSEWPGLLLDRGGACFSDQTFKTSEEPSPKKHEADLSEETSGQV